jgi:lipopolysaccharide/colanic/teichoic acid biosynthesis glycosyltransferase
LAESVSYVVAKRTVDILASAVGLVVLSPALLLIGVAIVIDSPGPILYVGERTGLHGRRFGIFKFRTMFVGSERGPRTTAHDDTRITRVGRVLRRWKLDELPQLMNVLRGEMSLVGPRPELPYYTDQYRGDELLILTVAPGITDLASLEFRHLGEIVGSRDVDRAYEERVYAVKNRLRIQYVRERGFFYDLRLIARTVAAIFR